MNDKVALVTGGARGNGFAIAKGMAYAGATLFIGDIAKNISEIPYPLSSTDTLAQAEAALRRINPRVHSIVLDVRDPEGVDRAVSRVEREAGGVDILVNNAGVIALNPLTSVSDAEWRAQHEVIVDGAFYCCRRVLGGMLAKGWGRIVNVASVAGHRGIGTGVAYTAAKHALIGLTRSLAMEVAGHGITVNAVCPGTVDTDLVRGLGAAMELSPGEALDHFSGRHPGGEPLAPEDVAAAALWLASDAARRVNGTSLFVDDGWHAH